MKPIYCIYHRADFDGIFCYRIAKQFFDKHDYQVNYIGWDYGDPVPEIPQEATVYMLDISVEGLMDHPDLRWVDHHKSAMEKYSGCIPGYRIDGVAACRLAWQYFEKGAVPTKESFVDRTVTEPLAVRLAGEYDIWDKRDSRTDPFQFGLKSRELNDWDWTQLLGFGTNHTEELVAAGEMLMRYQQQNDADVMKARSFVTEFEGLRFLALNTARCNSLTFAAKDIPETGHDALFAFCWTGEKWRVSLYHSIHRKDLDLSLIAVKHGGGGHRGACGFEAKTLPFLTQQ